MDNLLITLMIFVNFYFFTQNGYCEVSSVLEIKHHPTADSWTATITLPSEATGLKFLRKTNRFRKEMWKLSDPSLEIKDIDDHEVLVHKQGKAFKTATFTFASNYRDYDKDYLFHIKMTDGSVVFYTGHLNFEVVQKSNPQSKEKNTEETPIQYTFYPRKNESIVLMGKAYKAGEPVTWEDNTSNGTKVYFGNIKPIETEHMVAVIDSGLPPWALKALHKYVPELLAYFNKELGYKLDFKPTIFVSFAEGEEGKTKTKGGVLGPVAQFYFNGHFFLKETPEALEYLVDLIAHETAHLWNSSGLEFDMEDSWIHEGGADAMKQRALYALGILSKEKLQQEHQKNLFDCMQGLQGMSIKDSLKQRKFGNYYKCGATLYYLVETALKSKNKKLMEFISLVLIGARARGKNLNETVFFDPLEKVYKLDKKQIESLKSFINTPQTDVEAFMADLFKDFGLQLVKGELPEEHNKRVTKIILRSFFSDNCGKYSLDVEDDNFKLQTKEGCAAFKEEQKIARIDKYPINKQVLESYAYMKEQCRRKKAVAFYQTATDWLKPVKVKCEKEMVYVPNWYNLKI